MAYAIKETEIRAVVAGKISKAGVFLFVSQSERKDAAFTRFTFCPDISAVPFHELFA